MTLGQKQRHFTRLVGLLIEYAYQQGYELTFGDAYRDPRLHGEMGVKKSYSAANSNHKIRLAVARPVSHRVAWLARFRRVRRSLVLSFMLRHYAVEA